jgi:hypothetical protein
VSYDSESSISAAYSFLAALTENQNDLYNHVYVPICKRAISLYNSKRGRNSGKWSDIQEVILAEYGINVPQIITKQLINSVYKSMSSREKKQGEFRVFSNGEAFQFDKYTFVDLEESYQKSIRDANAFQVAFNTYLQDESILPDEVPPIIDFIEKNKKQIASFFGNSYTTIDNIDVSYYYHTEFFKYIKLNNHDLYKIAESQYIGSLVAAFLEAGLVLDPKFASGEVYYLDTPIILRALGLRNEDDTSATNDVLKLINETGGKLKVLSITIKETSNVIQDAIDKYNNLVPTSSINEACLRMGKQRAWLMKLLSNLEDTLKKNLGVSIEILPVSLIEKYSQSREIRDLQATRMKIGNARHDVLAYMYIRYLRRDPPSVFQKAKIWFLTTNRALLEFNKKHLIGTIPEIILSDSLTSLLWLKNPVKLKQSITGTGLSVLLASTLHEEIANRELINEFDCVLKSADWISEKDYRMLLESVAHQSAKKIESFVKLAETDEEKAKAEVQRIIEKERNRRNKEIVEKREYQKKIANTKEQNMHLDAKLKEIEANLSVLAAASKLKDEQSRAKEEIRILKDKYVKWIIISLIIIIVFLIAIIANSAFSFFPKMINWVMSSGGLFGFGSFIINLIKLFRNK